MRNEITACVPGNLLICGEYMILEDRGIGIGMATNSLARGRSQPSSGGSCIHVKTDAGRISLNTNMTHTRFPFIIRVYHSLIQYLKNMGHESPSLEVEIDTVEFFSDGRKLGLGASAAATVLLAGLMLASSIEKNTLNRAIIARAALEAHRHAQGKQGSGYDIFTSCYGAAGMFTGGKIPRWSPLREDHPLFSARTYAFSGPHEIDSREAVQNYQEWKKISGEKAADMFTRSQKLVNIFEKSSTEEHFFRNITQLRLLSNELGEQIGVESWLSPPSAFYEPAAWKGSGAGNELGLLFLSKNSESDIPNDYSRIECERLGLRLFNSSGEIILHG